MEKRQIQIEESKKEIKNHGNYAFPVNICVERIEAYDQGKFLWHWHPEIELTLILSGRMEYRINDQIYEVHAGEGLFGNSNTLHAGNQIEDADCAYLSITFHPRFLYGYEGSILQQKYVERVIGDPNMGSLLLKSEVEWQEAILRKMRQIYDISGHQPEGFEFQIHMLLLEIWYSLYLHFQNTPQSPANLNKSKHIQRLQDMITYLQGRYTEDVSLEEVAGHMNLCKNECCRFFKKYMNMTIVEYLTILRIQNSLPLLDQGESVTRTANLVGFSSPAYFSQMFRRHMHMSPKDYQKQEVRNS